MSSSGPLGGGPFDNIFGDIMRLLGSTSSGPINWDVARQITTLIAGEGSTEPNVDPLDRIQLEELARVAELHVNQQTALDVDIRSVEALTHIEWAQRTLDDYRPLLEELAKSLSQRPDSQSVNSLDDPLDDGPDALGARQFAQMEQLLAPMLMGLQAGGMVGHLSRRALGRFDLPIPRPVAAGTLVLIPANIKAFASDWSLPRDELSLYVVIEEATKSAILSRGHVHERLAHLLREYVSGFQPNEQAIQERLEQLDIEDPSQLPQLLSDPQTLLGAIQTPAQRVLLAQLNAIVAAYVGYVDHVVKHVAVRTIASASAIAEANKRRRVEESDGNRIVERLFGLELNQAQYDRGEAFVNGVLERAGDEGLARLWRSENELPTPAEVDAPGLWLERIDLPA